MKLIFELVVKDVNVSEELAKQKQLVKDLKKELDGIQPGAENFDQLIVQLANAKTAVLNLSQQQKELNREFKQASVATDSLAGLRLEYSRLAEQVAQLSKAERKSEFGKAMIANAKKIKDEINGIEESIGRFTGSVGNYQKALVRTFDLVSAGLITGGIERAVDLVVAALSRGVKAFAGYEKALDNLQALTGVAGAELEKFAQKADELTTIKIGDFEIVNTAESIVEAFKLVGGAQPDLLKSADALQAVTKQAIILSKASGDDLKTSVEAVITTLGQFSLGASEAERVANELAAGAKLGASEIPDTTKALKEFGTTAAVVNVSTSESIALIETLAEQQLKGGEAGTQLRNVLVRLSSADILPKSALAALKAAKVDIDVLRDSSLPLETRLKELGKLSGDTSKLVKVFGVENLTAAQILTQNVDRYQKFAKGLVGTNEAYDQAAINAGNLQTAYENLTTEGVNALAKGVEFLKPLLTATINVVAVSIKYVLGLGSALVQIPKFIQENKVALAGLVTGLTILNAEMIVTAANTLRLAILQRGQAIATAAVTAAQTLLNTAMRANPIGLVITAVSALAIGFNELYKRSETFRASIEGLGEFASELFKIVGESLSALVRGFKQIGDGNFSDALTSFGEFLEKSNPVGIALTQGERLGNAFNRGFNNTIQTEGRDRAENSRDDRQGADVSLPTKAAIKIKPIDDAFDKDAEKKAKKSQKLIDEQVKRINDLRKSIRELDAETITNEFDRRQIDIQNKRLEALVQVEEKRLEVEKKIKSQKGVATDSDKEELALISEQTASIVAAYDLQSKTVEIAREKAIDEQRRKLVQLSVEVTELAEQNAEQLVQAESEILNSDFSKQRVELLSVLNERKKALTTQLEEEEISQKKFKSETLKAQEAYNIGSLELERKRSQEIKTINEKLETARIESAKAALAVRLQAIETETETEINSLKERAKTEGGDPTDAIEKTKLKGVKDREKAELDFQDRVRAAIDANKQAQLDAANAVNDADEKVHEDKMGRLKEELEKRKELLKELANATIEITGTIAGAIFEIDKNRVDRQLTKSTEALDLEFEKKKKLAAGNSVELEKLDVQYQTRKEKLEKEAAQKRKKIALNEAIVQGALAVVKALPNIILAAVTAVAAAAQIAVINSQSFARGGVAGFRKSGVFGGRSHAQGGTRGRFSDGTDIEVEKDEVFIILNKTASKTIRQLSDFNVKHGGGQRFATGGALDFTPQFAVPGESQSQQIVVVQSGFSDEQVAQLSQQIAKETSRQTGAAVVAGLDKVNRTAERQQVLETNSQV